METRHCKKCKQDLPLAKFVNGKDRKTGRIFHSKDCLSCYKKDYYHRNKKKILLNSKKNRDKKREEKKEAGLYKWGSTQKAEEAKFQFFLNKHNVDPVSFI